VKNYRNPKCRNVTFSLFGTQESITQESLDVGLI
jgi:hypothetical protein